jgi:hypothetical protein
MLLFRLFHFLVPMLALWMAEGDPSGGGGEQGGSNPPAGGSANDGVNALISKHKNDLMAVILELFSDNYKARDKNREIRDQLKQLQDKLPKEGTVTVDSAKAALIEQYEALGSAEELKKIKADLMAASSELTGLKRQSVLQQAAEAHKFKVKVLAQLIGDTPIELKEVEADGKKVAVAFVTNGEGNPPTRLDEYVKGQWADFMPALVAETPPPAGTTFVPQNTGGGGAAQNIVKDFLGKAQQARDNQPNPLRKP